MRRYSLEAAPTMQNLRDKLLKAGLVSAEETHKAEAEAQEKKERARARPDREPARERNLPRGRGGPPSHERPHERPKSEPAERRVPKLPPLALPGSKAHQRLESLRQLELDK